MNTKEEEEDQETESVRYTKKPFKGFPYKGVDVPPIGKPIDMIVDDPKEPFDMDSFVDQIDKKIEDRVQKSIDKISEIEKNINKSIKDQSDSIKDHTESLYFYLKNLKEGEDFDKLIIRLAFILLWATVFASYVAPLLNKGIEQSVAIVQTTTTKVNSGIKILNNIGKIAGFKIPELKVDTTKNNKETTENPGDKSSDKSGSKSINLPNNGFIRPLPPQYRIGSKFSPRRLDPVGKKIYRSHTGSDLGAPLGTPIKASQDGKVYLARWKGPCGNGVGINHGSINGKNMKTIYCHLSSILVKSGQEVSQGDIIGLVGSTGNSTGPHLHYGLMINNKWADPQKHIID